MSIFHLMRVLFAIVFSGAIGWASLAVINMIRVTLRLEAFEARAPASDFDTLPTLLEEAVRTMQGGPAVFLGAGIAGVLLSEIFNIRSLLFHAGATGALTAVLAAALWPQSSLPGTGQAATVLALAGFVAGGTYWLIVGHSSPRD